jgi:hypothetical protein
MCLPSTIGHQPSTKNRGSNELRDFLVHGKILAR